MKRFFVLPLSLIFLTTLLSSCNQDMASYTRLSTEGGCRGQKIALLSPNIYAMDEDLFEAASAWIHKALQHQGYSFDANKKATVLVTLRHESKTTKKARADVDQTQESYEGEGSEKSKDLHHHLLTLWIDDNSCKKESMTLEASLETYNTDLREIIPELLQSLDDSLAHARGPLAKAKKKVSRSFV